MVHYKKIRMYTNFVHSYSQVPFDKLVYYIDNDLRSPSATLLSVLGSIEDRCWEMCETFFTSEALNTNELRKMWYIFNRYVVINTLLFSL